MSGGWFDRLVDWSTLLSALVAIVVLVVGVLASRSGFQARALLRRRVQTLYPATRRVGERIGHPVTRRSFRSAGRTLVRARVRQGNPRVRDELCWLSELFGSTAPEGGTRVAVPFTFAASADGAYPWLLAELAAAYEEYAALVRRIWLLRSAAGPLVEEEYACARGVATLLHTWSTFAPSPEPDDPYALRGRRVPLAPLSPGGLAREATLVTWPDMAFARAVPVFGLVGVSYQPYRVVTDDSPSNDAARRAGIVLREVADTGEGAIGEAVAFDGVLSRWHGPGYRLETDRLSGRQKLHLCVSEVSYFGFRATQRPGALARAGADALAGRLLSLNLVARDDHDRVLLAQRSEYSVHPGVFAGTVSGNCELGSREGLHPDFDVWGMPDLLRAIARESEEELGWRVADPRARLGALGVIEISSEGEVGTRVLVTIAQLPGSALDVRFDREETDLIEGTWEVGDDALVIDVPAATRDAEAARAYVAWLRSSPLLTPHSAGSLLLFLVARAQLAERRHGWSGAGAPLPWSTKDLAGWLSEPVAGAPPDLGDAVRRQPLWRTAGDTQTTASPTT